MQHQDDKKTLEKTLKDTMGNVFAASVQDPSLKNLPVVQGPEFNSKHSIASLIESYKGIGIQASLLHKAIQIIDEMYAWRLE